MYFFAGKNHKHFQTVLFQSLSGELLQANRKIKGLNLIILVNLSLYIFMDFTLLSSEFEKRKEDLYLKTMNF